MSGSDRNAGFKPVGTIAILIVYALLLLALWGNVYFTLLSRGVTQ